MEKTKETKVGRERERESEREKEREGSMCCWMVTVEEGWGLIYRGRKVYLWVMDENIYIGNEIGDLVSQYSDWLDLAVYKVLYLVLCG